MKKWLKKKVRKMGTVIVVVGYYCFFSSLCGITFLLQAYTVTQFKHFQ